MTPEQQAAQEALQVAVERHVRAFRPGVAMVEVTGDWLLVACITILDTDKADLGERSYAYNLAFSGGEQPEHIAYGLLREAEILLRDGELS